MSFGLSLRRQHSRYTEQFIPGVVAIKVYTTRGTENQRGHSILALSYLKPNILSILKFHPKMAKLIMSKHTFGLVKLFCEIKPSTC